MLTSLGKFMFRGVRSVMNRTIYLPMAFHSHADLRIHCSMYMQPELCPWESISSSAS